MKKISLVLVMLLSFAVTTFAEEKSAAAPVAVAQEVVVKAKRLPKRPARVPQVPVDVQGEKYSKADVSAAQYHTTTGKAVVRCRDNKSGRFVKCPE